MHRESAYIVLLSLLMLVLSVVRAGAQDVQRTSSEEADSASPPDMLRLINEAFDAASPLKWSDDLAEAARMHNEDMTTNVFRGHEGSAGWRAPATVASS